MANELGINVFSGPMGQKEPAYGAGERLKMMQALAPIGSPQAVGAPKRAKRAAVKGRTIQAGAPPQEPQAVSPQSPQGQTATYDQELSSFWQDIASHPDASPLVRQYASEAA